MQAATATVRRAWDKRTRLGFWALIATLFQGAFNDNAYKYIIMYYLWRKYPQLEVEHAKLLPALGLILFAVPYLLLPGLAGALADRFSKRQITIWTKWWEVGVMVVGLVAFYYDNPYFMGLMFLMMCTQSAFFSPAKYGILPEMLPESRLSWGNGILQMATFVAIIAGTGIVGVLYEFELSIYVMSLILIALSVVGLATSYGVTRVEVAAPGRSLPLNPWSGLGRYFKTFWGDHLLFITFLGGGFFWFAGALLQGNVLTFGKTVLGLGELHVSAMTAVLALGIGFGSVAAGLLSRRKIELGLVPIGVVGMTLSLGLLYLPLENITVITSLLFVLGFFSGFFEVPLAATIQHRSPKHIRGGMMATYNIITCLGILAAGFIFLAFDEVMPLDSHQVFLVSGMMTLGIGAYLCLRYPLFILRTALWVMASTLYKIRTIGRENIPEEGGALLVANHTSFVDALILTASVDRHLRFIMSQEIYEHRWIRPFARFMKAIPVSPMAKPKDLINSLRQATAAINNGELVCIFAEGQITRTGQLLPFRKGFEHIVKGTEAPIIPVCLDRLWGSVFSYSEGQFFLKIPHTLPFPVTVSYGSPMPNDTSAHDVRAEIQRLGTEAYYERKADKPLLHRAFVKVARRHPFHTVMADLMVPKLTYFKALVATISLGRKLRLLLDDHKMTGLLLPPSVGGALANTALTFMGKTAVNLNYTASEEALESAVNQCEIRHVLTSRRFLEKVNIKVPGEAIYLEDVKKLITKGDNLFALLMALFLPVKMIEWRLGAPRHRSQDELVTVIFSSGSEGKPKGVMLSHFNVFSNIEGCFQVFPHGASDGIVGILPFFHSFGYMATLWLPLTEPFFVLYHPNPLEPKVIGQLIYKYKPTFMVTAPTFLQAFIRRCLPEELSSLKYVITGAEKLPARIREAFHQKFGVTPYEGYGTTECAPVVAINVPNFRAPGFYQVGTKHGTVGHSLPGVVVRVKSIDTGEELPTGEPGLLHVKGPNIMQGYLKQPEKTAKVLKDGWYNTGDIATLDEDGFITITDRLSRFSKIGGEMVPHTKVEEILHEMLGLTEQQMVVTGIPDINKGEKLVVLHTLDNGELEDLVAKMDASDLPKLWLPKYNAFYRISEIPLLGTGKADIMTVKSMARDLDVGD